MWPDVMFRVTLTLWLIAPLLASAQIPGPFELPDPVHQRRFPQAPVADCSLPLPPPKNPVITSYKVGQMTVRIGNHLRLEGKDVGGAGWALDVDILQGGCRLWRADLDRNGTEDLTLVTSNASPDPGPPDSPARRHRHRNARWPATAPASRGRRSGSASPPNPRRCSRNPRCQTADCQDQGAPPGGPVRRASLRRRLPPLPALGFGGTATVSGYSAAVPASGRSVSSTGDRSCPRCEGTSARSLGPGTSRSG